MIKPNYKIPSQSNTTTPFWTNPQINKQHPVVTMFAGHIGTTSYSFNLNQQEYDEEVDEQQFTDDRDHLLMKDQDHVPKEHMFQKTLTPSDVGKLNRLVIPKQHAEKYFPLGGVDSSSEKRLLLSFEDESGKLWRFRYSYWNSSQSYVLTKGWSRYVKEKQLDAGDIVVFERYRMDGDRLFIGWRRSGTAMDGMAQAAANGGGRWTRAIYSEHPYPSQPNGPPLPYKPHCLHAGTIVQNQSGSSSGNSKRFRLFGVNFECQSEPDDSTTDIGSSISSSHGEDHYRHYYPHPHASDHHNHMDINFPRDVN